MATKKRRTRAAKAGKASRARRKNFVLDQNRLDRAKAVLGAKTESEAITRALDLTLSWQAFANAVRKGSGQVFGRGGVRHVFDDEDSLDFSGFGESPTGGRGTPRGLRATGKRRSRDAFGH
jgi:hypothetical protein